MTRDTLDRLIGCRLAVGFPGTEVTQDVIEALRATRAQSLVLFSRNFVSVDQLTKLLQRLNEALGQRFLVMVDHEGGRVIRFQGAAGLTPFPDALTVGKSCTSAQIEAQGRTEAEELRRLGVQVNLAPCVDVIVEGSDPIIGNRSYGSDPARVAAFGVARIRGLQSNHVAACAKHFPGLGAVPRDPHKALPTISLEWTAMEDCHLVPFRTAIGAGVAMVMSSHVCYPGLGEPPGVPATFSRRLIHDLLRERLGFPGLILTDDLEMGALRTFGSIGEAAVRATEAGHDLLLVCSDLAAQDDACTSLRRAYQSGRLDARELAASADRFKTVRKKYLE